MTFPGGPFLFPSSHWADGDADSLGIDRHNIMGKNLSPD